MDVAFPRLFSPFHAMRAVLPVLGHSYYLCPSWSHHLKALPSPSSMFVAKIQTYTLVDWHRVLVLRPDPSMQREIELDVDNYS